MRDMDALKSEWLELCAARKMDAQLYLATRTDRAGRDVFIVHGAHGHHESPISHADAMESLVDSHRTRIEDLATTHAMVQAWGGSYADIKIARKWCADTAAAIREKHAGKPGEERDKLVIAAIEDQTALLDDAKKKAPRPVQKRRLP